MIKVGSIVVDNHHRRGIVCYQEACPDEKWISEQVDERIRQTPQASKWWGIMPLTGGFVLCPESILRFQGQASYDDFIEAAEHANLEGRKTLAMIFPEFVKKAIEKRAINGNGQSKKPSSGTD